jgi:myo-inositol-1(or 4)-monophosphatase
MNEFTKLAEKAGREAGAFLKEKSKSALTIEKKGQIDLVTDADRGAEEIIKEIILSSYPDHRIIAEEGGETFNDSRYLWLVDPLDGTTNFAHGLPFYCVSIALMTSSELLSACIYNPILDECFIAEKGSGAFLNGERISVSKTELLGDSLLATGFPYDIRTSQNDNIAQFRAFAKTARAVRRPGSAALDLVYAACGRLDGFWEFKLSPWDVAAGILMVLEAGGRVTSWNGTDVDIMSGEVLASNGIIHKEMIKVLQSCEEPNSI